MSEIIVKEESIKKFLSKKAGSKTGVTGVTEILIDKEQLQQPLVSIGDTIKFTQTNVGGCTRHNFEVEEEYTYEVLPYDDVQFELILIAHNVEATSTLELAKINDAPIHESRLV